MATVSKQLSYSQLQSPRHIRFFSMSPGKPDDAISGTIKQVDIDSFKDDGQATFALSYLWGHSTETGPVIIKDEVNDQVGIVQITQTLLDILRKGRNDKTTAVIWVDQICIDQSDQKEKENQISLMRLIYQKVGVVMSYLGSSGDGDRLAMRLLNGTEWNEILNFDAALSAALIRAGMEATEENRDYAFNAIRMVIEQRYWSRTWIWLEATARSDRTFMVCGGSTVNLRQLLTYLISFKTYVASGANLPPKWPRASLMKTTKFLDFWTIRMLKVKQPLRALLQNLRDAHVTDARDKIMAVVPFADDVDEQLQIGYDIVAPIAYIKYVLWDIVRYQSLDVFSYCRGGFADFLLDPTETGRITTVVGDENVKVDSRADSGGWSVKLPSWVPDWRSTPVDDAHKQIMNIWPLPKTNDIFDLSTQPLFSASGSVKREFYWNHQDANSGLEGLVVDGVKIATIAYVETGQRHDIVSLKTEESWHRSFSETGMSNWQHDGNDLFKRTLYTDLKPRSVRHINQYSRIKSPDDLIWPYDPSKQDAYFDLGTLKLVTNYRLPFHTKGSPRKPNGLYGLGPMVACPGDEIWILQGASVPFVLRPRQQSYSTKAMVANLNAGTVEQIAISKGEFAYLVVGECFILGLMDGEVLDLMQLGEDDIKRREVPELERQFHRVVLA